jgi:predicted Zn finger-like uncharacterized protein
MGSRFLDIRLKISDLDCDPLERSETAMILTCPKCATRFFADDHAIGPEGRRVKCDACGEVWSSTGAKDVADLSAPADPATAHPIVSDGVDTANSPLFVERGSPPRQTVRKRSRAPWVIGLLVVALAVVGIFVFQHRIERMFPGASTVYQSLGFRDPDRAVG